MDQLQTAAQSETYRSIDRLVDEWAIGTNRFSEQDERLLIARHNGRLVGIGGMTIEPKRQAGRELPFRVEERSRGKQTSAERYGQLPSTLYNRRLCFGDRTFE